MPSLHQLTSETSASPADQLHHISWTTGFASASQPLPASPCRHFIAHQAMGVRIESQFWESPYFGLLEPINQVLLILVIFLAWVYFSRGITTLVCFIICTQVCQMVAALMTVALWFGLFPYIVRRTPHPELGLTCEFRLCHVLPLEHCVGFPLKRKR